MPGRLYHRLDHDPMTDCPNSNIPGTTAISWSPPAAASACTGKKSISRPCSPARNSVLKEIDDGICIVSFMHYDLGYIDLEQRTLQTSRTVTRCSPPLLLFSADM